MKQQTEFSAKDYSVIEREYASLKEVARRRCSESSQMDTIQKAFEFANSAHNGIRRRSGDPYILHPIAVAKIVADEIGLGYRSISAALLHDVVEDSAYTVEDIRNLFGEKIASLVDGLSKIKAILEKKDMMLTLNDDIRIVLIKLADRLHNCRTIEYLPDYKREKALSETMDVFIPLAHRLGLYSIKSEMEDIWLRFKEPEAYNRISMLVSANARNYDKMMETFLSPIRVSLDNAGLNYIIKKRIKTPYSIWHKINTKNVTFEQISDLYAARVIFTPDEGADEVAERNECFQIFSLITSIYEYRPDRIRDWIMHPKPNGYEALHLTALTQDGINIEVQIRSRRMDEIAEKGVAAHWNYKQTDSQTDVSQMDICIDKVKDLLENPDANTPEMLDVIHDEMTENELVVFDNKDRRFDVQKGWTALDFAYLSSVDTGNHAIAAKINYRLSPLSQELKSGDRVEIITSQSQTPKEEWLDFVRSEAAIQALRDCYPQVGSHNGHKTIPEEFPVRISVEGLDRKGLIHDISGIISKEESVCFKAISFRVYDGMFEGFMDIRLRDRDTLNRIMDSIRSVSGIQTVNQTESR